jgi:hypothetical protein
MCCFPWGAAAPLVEAASAAGGVATSAMVAVQSIGLRGDWGLQRWGEISEIYIDHRGVRVEAKGGGEDNY